MRICTVHTNFKPENELFFRHRGDKRTPRCSLASLGALLAVTVALVTEHAFALLSDPRKPETQPDTNLLPPRKILEIKHRQAPAAASQADLFAAGPDMRHK